MDEQKHYIHRIDVPDEYTLVMTDHLFGVPLYAWYVVMIERFAPGDIQGVLMSTPLDIFGPFADFEEASTIFQQMSGDGTGVD